MSNSNVPEIPADVLDQVVPNPRGRLHLTVRELRAVLEPLGLDVTTKEAVDWAKDYPNRAGIEAELVSLRARLGALQQKLEALRETE